MKNKTLQVEDKSRYRRKHYKKAENLWEKPNKKAIS